MIDKVIIPIIDASGRLPRYATTGSAGMDIRAFIKEAVTIQPGGRALIPTGLRVAIPEGYEMQIRPRSGLALKHGICVLNSPGTVDSDYRGEIGIILANLSDTPFVINDGDRIAQMVVAAYSRVEWEPVQELPETERGAGGFGHTGQS